MLCDDLKASMGRSRAISIQCKADSRPLGMDQAVTLGLITNELVTNAIKHAFPDQRPGRICAEFAGLGDQSLLFVEDSGVGLMSGPASGSVTILLRALASTRRRAASELFENRQLISLIHSMRENINGPTRK